MRNTKQRQFILEFVNNCYSHPTAQTIYEEVGKVIPNISLGTVYRLLNKLVSDGMIKRIKMPDNIDRYDRITGFHAHFLCQKCNNVYDLDKIINLPVDVTQHIVIDYEINLKGICQECKKGIEVYGIKR